MAGPGAGSMPDPGAFPGTDPAVPRVGSTESQADKCIALFARLAALLKLNLQFGVARY